jgi:hypothetical protein
MRALLAALSRTYDARVVVVSGSPTFLRRRILSMFQLHGIRCDRLVLKDFGAALRRGRLRTLQAQVPYKLRAHLETRLWLAARNDHVPEICFGDDAEVDALVYWLARILEVCGAYPDEIATILERAGLVDAEDPVRRIFIHLEGNSPPARFGAYRGRVTATFNALQIAVHLASEGLADDRVLVAVAEELVQQHKVTAEGLAGSLEDAVRRGLCDLALAERLASTLLPRTSAAEVGFSASFAARVLPRLGPVPQAIAPQPVQPLPYESLFEAERAFARARKVALKTAARLPGLAEFLGAHDREER